MGINIIGTLMSCDDCLMLVANGEPSEGNPYLEQHITDHLSLAPLQYLVCGDSDNEIEFTWRACECCGSVLGGRRNELILVRE